MQELLSDQTGSCIVRATGAHADVLISGEYGGGLPAHRWLLSARSERVAAHFRFLDTSSAWASGSTSASASSTHGTLPYGTSTLPTSVFPSLSPRTLPLLLSYFYTGRLSGRAQEADTDTLTELAVAADEFLLPGLLWQCQAELCRRVDPPSALQLLGVSEIISGLSELRRRASLVLLRSFHEIYAVQERQWKEDGVEPEQVLRAALESLAST